MEEKTKDMEISRESKELKEGELTGAAGGFLQNFASMCYFTPKGGLTVRGGNDGYAPSYWMECNSSCGGLVTCACHGHAHCKDKWHRMDSAGKLMPREYKNHTEKPKANNYNTK